MVGGGLQVEIIMARSGQRTDAGIITPSLKEKHNVMC